MRAIKFRGKRIDNGEWVEGYYLQAAGMSFISAFAVREPILVDAETVGQFTGLYDKNDREIYEGDVVLRTDDGLEWICVWREDCWLFNCTNGDTKMQLQWLTYALDKLEVIGNVHEKE